MGHYGTVPELWKTHSTRFPQARWTADRTRRPQRPTRLSSSLLKKQESGTTTTTITPFTHGRLIDNTDVPASLRSDHDGLDEVITMRGMRIEKLIRRLTALKQEGSERVALDLRC